MSETEIKLFRPLKEFQNYFSDNEHVGKYLWAAISPWNNSEVILVKFPRAKVKLLPANVGEGLNNFISHVRWSWCNRGIT